MTLEEAQKIARVAETADDGCTSCVPALCEELNKADLGFRFWYHEASYEVLVEEISDEQ